MMRIYHDATGNIHSWDYNNAVPSHDVFIKTDGALTPNHLEHHVDMTTKTLRTKTSAERVTAMVPTVIDVRSARYHELKEFDWRENHVDWKEHRQALRDITKAPNAVEMVRNWPKRPDGTDAIPHLRRRLPENI